MARIKLKLPETFHFATEIPVRISDVNYGGHVGNDSILTIIHEARVQFFRKYGYTELDVEGLGIVLADATTQYKSQIFHGDTLRIEIAVSEFTRYGCTFNYRLISLKSGKEASLAKTTISFFDYKENKVANVPKKFKSFFEDK
ncbi:MAG: thioesterase [Gammaproteobacteria bacterium SG8_11]|nr:MAG: thioesterase [Gammaproteobacteria bacterium SG8_11]